MSKVVSISEAASIAMHGIILIARSDQSFNVVNIANRTSTSRHHVAKVMQRLVKEGFITSTRGPNGGFRLARSPEAISLLDLYEAIEGKIEIPECPMEKPICSFDKCMMSNLTQDMTRHFIDYLKDQTVDKYLN